jgi:enoyl-CoA hydratase/carnithine racemase
MGEEPAALVAHASAHRVPLRAALQRDRQAAAPRGAPGALGGRVVADAAAPIPLADLLPRLASPFALEDFSPLLGARWLAVDLNRAPQLDARALEAARERLAQLPCPTLGWPAQGLTGAAAALAPRFDVLLAERSAFAPLCARIERWPQASSALVQLLRHSEGASLHEALIAESLVYSTLQSGPEFRAWLAQRRPPRERPPVSAPAVQVVRSGALLELWLDRPEKRNAFSAEMRDALVEGLQVAAADPEVREVVLRGRGPDFCSGGDLDEFGTLPDPATAHLIRSTRNAGRLLASLAGRVRAELHGACVGAGMELPAFAGRVVARPGAYFVLPELGLGLVPGAGGTASLPRRIGRQRTAWLALSGQRIDAQTALAWGLVDEVR